MLFDVDFVTDLLWPSPNIVGTPEACEKRRDLAANKLAQYGVLVKQIETQATDVIRRLRSLLPEKDADPFTYPGVATIVVRNSGASDGELELEDLYMSAGNIPCASTKLAALDPYTRKRSGIAPERNLVVRPGASVRIEIELDCRVPKHTGWKLWFRGGSLDVPFSPS
jgi:hypothetical protein